MAREKTLISLSEPGDRGAYVGRNGERDSVTGSASGSLAPGFSVTQTERTVDGPGRGSGVDPVPANRHRLLVRRGRVRRRSSAPVLVLTNPEIGNRHRRRHASTDGGASSTLQVRAACRSARAPSVDLRIDEVAPGEKVLAVHAQVRVGRLSAAITETDVNGFEPGGTDWIPAASRRPPDTRRSRCARGHWRA